MFHIENQSINTSVCYYLNEKGRSMIEMLGVLAIVGILSVGAISGFSQAMFKHKLQKTTEEYVMFFQDTLKYYKELIALRGGAKPGEGSHYWIAELLYNMGVVPSVWRRSGTTLYDRLNNRMVPFIRKENNKLNFDIRLIADETSIFICEAIYRDVFMQFSDSLYYIQTYRQNSEGQASGAYLRYGNLYCNKTTKKCVRDMTLIEIRKTCSVCAKDDERCIIIIDF